MERKKVTFADIAKYTNFSKTTISRYFNNPDSLTLENQEKIAKALEELGYQKNKLAKVLANGKCFYTDKCRKRAEQYFDMNDRYQEYINLYNHILDEKEK